MEIRSQLNNIRLAPRKVRSVAGVIKGKNVDQAIETLEFLIRKPALPMIKLLNSSIANAENNFNMVRSNLYVKNVLVNEGVKLKRYMPKGFGRAGMIQKKTSHIIILLDERQPGLKKDLVTKKEEVANIQTQEEKKESLVKKPEIKRELGKKNNVLSNIGKKIFRRKAI